MKKTLLSLFSILSVAVTAQTLTYANHAPAWGNIPYTIEQCDSLGVTPGSAGAAQTWNFAVTNPKAARTYTTSNTLPNNSSYPNANVSVYSALNDVSYYFSDNNSLKYYGGNLVINAYDLTVKYAQPAILAVYPMSLNTTTTAAISGTISLVLFGFPVNPTFTGTSTVTAEGTGTLVLPAKTFNDAVRVKTSQLLSASGATVNLVNYDYYSVSTSKAPMYSIQTSTIMASGQPTNTQTITTVQKGYQFVGIHEVQSSKIELTVFPNPATTSINFSTSNLDAAKVIAFDVAGNIVATETMEMGKGKMNTSSLSNGIYLYSVLGKDNQVLKTGKFNITK